jgi:arylsulfatase A-like enzyme
MIFFGDLLKQFLKDTQNAQAVQLMGKQNLYEHSVRVPLILRGPGLPAGLQVEAQHYSFDLFATLCTLIGVTAPDSVAGRDLTPALQQPEPIRLLYPTLFGFYDDIQRSVKDSRWKLIRYYRSKRRNAGSERIQLFDLANDPWETDDLAADPAHTPRRDALLAELARWQQTMHDPLAGPISDR